MQTYQNDIALEYSEGGFELPDEGSYTFKFLGVIDTKDWPKTTKEGANIYDEDGHQVMETSLTLQFVIDDPESDFDGVEFRDYFPLKVTNGNKSGRLWAALWGVAAKDLPVPLPPLREFVNKRASGFLTHRAAKNGNSYAKLDSVAPLPRKKKARPVEVEEDDDAGF